MSTVVQVKEQPLKGHQDYPKLSVLSEPPDKPYETLQSPQGGTGGGGPWPFSLNILLEGSRKGIQSDGANRGMWPKLLCFPIMGSGWAEWDQF